MVTKAISSSKYLKVIKEVLYLKSSYFLRYYIINNRKYNEKKVFYTTHHSSHDNQNIFLLYDTNMRIIEDVYYYINFEQEGMSQRTKESRLYSLRFLYVFCDLFDASINELNNQLIKYFVHFLYGYSSISNNSQEIVLLRTRNAETVNEILSVCRLYLKWKKNKSYKLLKLSTSFLSNLPNRNNMAKKYISVLEFKQMSNYIRNDITSEEDKLKFLSIIELMFLSSLRVGEVLGLTFEDLNMKQVNGNYIYFVVIRNRNSDNNHQLAKTCMNVSNQRDYESSAYRTQEIGFQIAYLSRDTYMKIEKYIEIAHNRHQKNEKYILSKADQVTDAKLESENRYLFLNNRLGSNLSRQQLNQYMRKVFTACNIPIDFKTRTNNLNHRFRHGFVMKLLYDEKIPPEQVMKLSRHKSITSLNSYNKLSDETFSKLYESFEIFLEDANNEED